MAVSSMLKGRRRSSYGYGRSSSYGYGRIHLTAMEEAKTATGDGINRCFTGEEGHQYGHGRPYLRATTSTRHDQKIFGIKQR